jgi:type 1 fimbria pilin
MTIALLRLTLLAPLLAAGQVQPAAASPSGSLQVGAYVAPQSCSITLHHGTTPTTVEDCSEQQDTGVAAALRQPQVVRGFGGAAGPEREHPTVAIVY